jgi:hypothetical protein
MATWTVCTPLQQRCYDNESDAQYYAARLYHDARERDVWITLSEGHSMPTKLVWASDINRWRKYPPPPSNETHTPGPWEVQGTRNMGFQIKHLRPGRISELIALVHDRGECHTEKNALLMAAAPALKDVCEMIVDYANGEDKVGLWFIVTQAREALAEATGQNVNKEEVVS